MGRKPADIRSDVTLAGEALARGLDAARRRGWIAPLLLGAGAVAALFTAKRRPVRDVARQGRRVVDTTLTVAAALAAYERYRRRKRAA